MVAPLAQLDEIWPIAREAGLIPPASDLTFARPHFGPWFDWAVLVALPLASGAALAVAGGIPGAWLLTLTPLMAIAAARLSWRSTSHAADAQQLYARHGWWSRTFSIARQVNVQSVTLSRGPLERWRGLATIHFGIAGGALHFTAVPYADALAIRAQVLDMAAPVDFSALTRPG